MSDSVQVNLGDLAARVSLLEFELDIAAQQLRELRQLLGPLFPKLGTANTDPRLEWEIDNITINADQLTQLSNLAG